MPHVSSNSLLIYDQILRDRNSCSSPDRKPFEGILVVERPWGNYGDEGKGGSSESDVDGELDILQEVADQEGDGLFGVSAVLSPRARLRRICLPDLHRRCSRRQLKAAQPASAPRNPLNEWVSLEPCCIVIHLERSSIRSAPRRCRGPGPGFARPC